MKTAAPRHDRASPKRATEAGEWLHRAVVLIAVQARKDVGWIGTRPKTAIHSLRKRMKKLQSLLHLATPALDDQTLNDIKGGIREIKDAAMSQRDSDVLCGLAHDLGVDLPPWHTTRPAVGMLDAYVSELIARLEELDLSGLTWNGVVACHLRSCRRARKAWKKAREHPSEDNLHVWRKRVKDQYHQSLALHRWLGRNRSLRRMRRLGSQLGRCHDLHLLASVLPRDKTLKRKIGTRSGKLKQRVFSRAERLFANPVSQTQHRVSKRLPADDRRKSS